MFANHVSMVILKRQWRQNNSSVGTANKNLLLIFSLFFFFFTYYAHRTENMFLQ